MPIKDNVRQRRLERIKSLQENNVQTERMNNEQLRLPVPFEYSRPDMERLETEIDPRLNDPEYVWRQKFRLDHEEQIEPPLSLWSGFRTKVWIALLMFILIWALFQIKHPIAQKGQSYIATMLVQPISYDSLTAWYHRTFGDSPSFIPVFDNKGKEDAVKVSLGNKRTYFAPLQGKVTVPYSASNGGILLSAQAGAPVFAMDDGQVIRAGESESTGYTVVIQHPEGVQSVYGWMDGAKLQLNDWIKAGETIGYAAKDQFKETGILYFAIKKDKMSVDPADVISFD
ncbi:M23 family metallopeptidase [Paenibacillus sp. N1-5-1-14]|uniref:M23 family metallopeptidase n=1 Tax=Paenibacillus radicibacter TaxID=2972488 RepID=UPI0021596A7A|nr:M23 family metallopeptidase [Paenibacillus radicibacter]MCR8644139.1 M23 family metallopeptidase [Paenibacillus radicibacter]